ncbi:MAG: hypothetical protein AAFW46_03385 [Pseudomonadota bacterium]
MNGTSGLQRAAWAPAARAAAAALAMSVFGAGGVAQAEQRLQLTNQAYEFEVRTTLFPNLTLASGEIRLSAGASDYNVEIDAKALVAGTPINWKGAFRTAGVLSEAAIRPKSFFRSSVRSPGRDDERRTDARVDWRADGPPVTEITRVPARVREDRVDVDVSQAGEVVDPLSFMVGMLERVVRTNGADCSTLRKTWDGERLAVIETQTAETVPAARIDCKVIYKAILGLSARNRWRVQEEDTQRIIRFRKVGGLWQPEFLRIDATLIGGLRTTFTTTLTPIRRTGG